MDLISFLPGMSGDFLLSFLLKHTSKFWRPTPFDYVKDDKNVIRFNRLTRDQRINEIFRHEVWNHLDDNTIKMYLNNHIKSDGGKIDNIFVVHPFNKIDGVFYHSHYEYKTADKYFNFLRIAKSLGFRLHFVDCNDDDFLIWTVAAIHHIFKLNVKDIWAYLNHKTEDGFLIFPRDVDLVKNHIKSTHDYYKEYFSNNQEFEMNFIDPGKYIVSHDMQGLVEECKKHFNIIYEPDNQTRLVFDDYVTNRHRIMKQYCNWRLDVV